jgi:hypothetical protein
MRRLASKDGPKVFRRIVTDAANGDANAQRLFMTFMVPRSKLIDQPVERQPVATTEQAAARVAEALARMEAGSLDLDEAQAVAALAQAFTATRNVADLERRSAEMVEQIEMLKAEVEAMKERNGR